MITKNIGEDILNGLFGNKELLSKANTSTGAAASSVVGGVAGCYIGLHKGASAPEVNAGGAITGFTEPDGVNDTYKRVALSKWISGSAANSYVQSEALITVTTGVKAGETDVTTYASNNDMVMFREAKPAVDGGTGWGTVTHFGLFSAASGADAPYYVGELNESMSVDAGKVALFRLGKLVVTIGADGVVTADAGGETA